jgi:hypothetical protein
MFQETSPILSIAINVYSTSVVAKFAGVPVCKMRNATIYRHDSISIINAAIANDKQHSLGSGVRKYLSNKNSY